MNSNTIAKFHLFGKVGKIVMTVLSVIAALITVSCCIATAFTATLPEDALTVRVVEHAEFRFNKASFDTLWSILGGSFTYSGKEFPEYMLEDSEKKASPPENQEFQAELKIFNQSYASAEIHSDESAKVMEADTSPEEYNIKDLVTVFIFLTLFSASATAALWMLRRLFAVLTRCGSPATCCSGSARSTASTSSGTASRSAIPTGTARACTATSRPSICARSAARSISRP